MDNCQHCSASELVKSGYNRSGSQRYLCNACGRTTTLEPESNGYHVEIRTQALRLYLDGNGFRAIGRQLGVNHQSVANWVNAYTAQLPTVAPRPETPEIVEVDELFTFVQQKKTKSTLSRPSSAKPAVSRVGRSSRKERKRPYKQ